MIRRRILLAFELLGTFTASQFTRFSTWVQAQVGQIPARIQHLQAELARIGALAFAFDSGGIPTFVQPADTTTYIGRLFQVYEALGGDVEFDLQTRSMTQPVFRTTGTENHMPQLMSNGEVISSNGGLSDAPSAELVRQARDWTYDAQFYRRDFLERKIRRAMDYADQLSAEIKSLRQIQAEASQAGSIGYIVSGVQQLIANRYYIAAQNDAAAPDPHGKSAYGPVAGYMPSPEGGSTIVDYERTYDGPKVPTGTQTGTGT
jgi:hypothetical protein